MAQQKKTASQASGTTKKSSSAGSKSGKTSGASKGSGAPRSKAAEKEIKAATGSKVKDEIFSIIIIAVGVLLLLSIQANCIGPVGSWLHDFFFGCFGLLAYVLPYYLIVYGVMLLMNKTVHITGRSFTLMLLIYCFAAMLNAARYIDEEAISFSLITLKGYYAAGITKTGGGLIGMLIGSLIAKALGVVGLDIIAIVGIIICLLLVINTPITQFLEESKIRRIERRVAREEELAVYERQQAERRAELEKEREVNARYAQMNKEKREESKSSAIVSEKLTVPAEINKATNEKELSPYDKAKLEKKRENILSYMNDDQLFGSEQTGGDLTTPGSMKMGILKQSEHSGQTMINIAPEFEETADTSVSEITQTKAAPAETATAKETQSVSAPAAEPVKKLSKAEAANAMLSTEEINSSGTEKPYVFPPIDLLKKSKGNQGSSASALKDKAYKLEETLRNFHVDAKVVAVTQGPAVTRYEVQPAVGVKVSSITRLADDIALNLEAKSIRLEAPIPGKAAVGIEVENDKVNFVNLRDVIDTKEFKDAKSRISFAVGKDIAGNAIVGDLKSMPHLLIAGSTGSGKSVCVNSIILSILYKATPEEVKLVLIDPKVVELGNYNGIPHLLIPVVTEPAKAAAALNWAVAEMDDRYRKFAEVEVRDLESYNDYVKANQDFDLVLPQIVIIIDELADLMMAAPSQVEESICRLAQKARAAGMHLIVATQRPSVDVVTGLIKANVPSRIAFAVSSQIDSRVILDKTGAEKLVGKGDMLYNPLGMGQPIRVQGAFVSDGEVNSVIDHIKSQITEAEYNADVIHTIERAPGGVNSGADDDSDELLPEAIETVVHAGQASVSMLQRRFRIGYNRAARIVDMMEARGIVGPADGARPRQVLLSEDELEDLKEEGVDLD